MRSKRRTCFDKDDGFNKNHYEPKTKEPVLVRARVPIANQVRHEEKEMSDEELAREYCNRKNVYRQDA